MPITPPGGGRQAEFQGADVVGVVVHRLGVTRFLRGELRHEALGLVCRIVQLGEAGWRSHGHNEQLERSVMPGVASFAARQRRDFGRIVVMKVGWISSCSVVSRTGLNCSRRRHRWMMIGAHFFQLRLQEGAVVELFVAEAPGWYLWIDWVMVRRSKGWAR